MNKTLSSTLYQKQLEYSDLGALKINDDVISYKKLNSKALKLASYLISRGVSNKPIGIFGQRKISHYVGILAAIYSNCHYVPINKKYTNKKIREIIEAGEIKYVISSNSDLSDFNSLFSDLDLSEIIVPECKSNNVNWIGEDIISEYDEYIPANKTRLNDLVYIMFTSGTTGKPKGVMVSNKNIVSWLKSMSIIYNFDKGFRSSQTYDLSFDLSVADMFFTWTNGGMLCILPENESLLPLDYIKREKINLWSSVPTLATFMFKLNLLNNNIFPDLKVSIFCGEPLPTKIAEAWQNAAPNSTVENLYGPTEATIWITRYKYSFNDSKNYNNTNLPIGKIFDNHELNLIDENSNLLINDNLGEIIYKGPQISLGYLNDKIKTDNNFVKFDWDKSDDIWYESGDIGMFNDQGVLECLGRVDNQIKIGGRRVEIGEIESGYKNFKKTKDAIVVPQKDKNNIVTGLICFITNSLTVEEELEIKKSISIYVEKIFIPKKIISIKKFPLTTSGKIDRNQLQKLI